MTFIRELVAISIFVASVFLCITLTVDRFHWLILVCVIISFLAAYFIWPSKKKGQREESNWFLDIMEVIIELPVAIFLGVFRLMGHLFRKADGSDVDL